MEWMGIANVWAFVAAVLVFLALPGPGTFTLLTSTARGGMRAGYATFCGLLLGDQVLIWLAVAGVAAVLQANPLLFNALRLAGVAYVGWIGLQLLRTPRRQPTSAAPALPQRGHYFRQGVLVALLNPKAIIFYMAFLPLFVAPATQRGLATFATMAVLIAALSLLWCSVLIVLGDALARRLAQRPRVALWMRRLTGAALLGFAVRLALG